MAKIRVRELEFNLPEIRDSYDRRAILFKNNIIESLKKIGLQDYQSEIELPGNARIAAPASASWYFEGYFMHYSCNSQAKYIENLFIVSKVIELKVKELVEKHTTFQDFISYFTEEKDIAKTRKSARSDLGLPEDCRDMALITKTYKQLAKQHHPDANDGSDAEFKKINNAYQILRRELE